MKKLLLSFVLFALSFGLSVAVADVAQGSATGFMKMDGKQYPIRFAYALGIGDHYWLLLTDAAVPAELFKGATQIRGLGADGKTHGLLVTLDSKGNPNPIMVLQAVEATGNLDWQKFELTTLSKEALEGKTRTLSPQKGADKTYEYDISFKAPVTVMR